MPKGVYPRPTAKDRFWRKVDKEGPTHPILKTHCWIWTGARIESNYGIFTDDSKNSTLVHRYSFELHKEKIPIGMCICHHCDNPPCVNPSHLFIGTRKDNNKDRDNKNRQVVRKGEQFTHAKLNNQIVQEIRSRYSPGCLKNGANAMSREYGVSTTLIKYVIRKKIWKHI